MKNSKIWRAVLVAALFLLLACAMTPLEAGLAGAATGAVTTMVLDSEPDIIVDGASVVAESNVFSFLESIIRNIWSLVIFSLIFWLMPSPNVLLKKWKNKNEK